jgi:hypothetical protein
MQPQNPYIAPVQQPQAPANFDFTAQNQPQQQPIQQQPLAPAMPDPALTQVQSDLAEIKTALGGVLQQQPQPQAPAPEVNNQPIQKYDEWGAVFQDTAKQAQDIVDKAFKEREQQQQQSMTQAQQQEQQNQQYIDNTVGQLRQAGYLPPVTNQFDANDTGKQAENELLGYAISLGSTDLIGAAKELKFRHDAGFKYDHQSKQFVQVNAPNTQDPNGAMFGNLPQVPDGQPQQQFPQQFQPAPYQQPVGPQNPYMQPQQQQYPAGFNAPVSSGNSFQGTQGGVPALRNLRGNSYDALVDAFNRTQ